MGITDSWRRERPNIEALPREPMQFPMMPPPPALPARSRSKRVAEAEEHVESLEAMVEEQRGQITILQGRLSVVDESNAILHEQIAGMEAKHATAIAAMQTRLDKANEAVTAVSTLVGVSASLLMECRRYLYPATPEDTTVNAEAIGRRFGANSQAQAEPQEGEGG